MSQRYIGGLIYNPPGGFSGYFDGSGDYLSVGDQTAFEFGSGDYTVELWWFPTSSSNQNLIGKWDGGGSEWILQWRSSGYYRWASGGSVVSDSATMTLALNTWNHVVVTKTGTSLRIYTNGSQINTTATEGTISATGASLTIGDAQIPSSPAPVTGYISNVRLLKGTALYTSSTYTVPSGQLQAITNTSLLTCAYGTFRDGSSNNFTITVNGNTAVSVQNPFPLTALPNPALGNQGNGVYSMSQYQALRSQNLWPAIDQYWPYVTLMLHGNGTNGAQNNTFLDSSTNNFTITRNGNTTQGTFTPFGSNWSNYFDPSGDYLTATKNADYEIGSGDFTVEAWIFPTEGGSLYNSGVFSYGASSSLNGYLFGITGSNAGGTLNRVMFEYNYDGTLYTSTSGVTLNAWNHIAVSRSGSNIYVFLNGNLQSTTSTSKTANTNAGDVSVIGSESYDPGSTNRNFRGYISNLRLVKGTAVYTSAFTPPTAPLTAITNTSLLTCQSNRFIDNSTNAFTITRNGDVSVQRFSPFNPTAAYSAATIGGSGYFDGSGDYLTLAPGAAFAFGTGDFTVETFFLTTSSSIQYLFDARNSGQTGTWAFQLTPSTGNIVWFNGSADWTVNTTINLNSWNHIAYVRSGTTGSLYLNGVRLSTQTDSTNYSVSPTTSYIGSRYSATEQFTGYMSNVRLLKGTALYTGSTYTVPTSPLTAITNTQLLLNFTNGGIIDNAMMNDLETVGNAQISTSVSRFGGGSLAFDGSGDYLLNRSSPSAQFPGNFTVEAWIYPLATGNGAVFDTRTSDATATGFYFGLYTGSNALLFFTGGAVAISGGTAPVNTWTHIALVRFGSAVTIYVNGQSVGTATSSANFSDGNVFIGSSTPVSGSSANSFNGYIDDLRITKGYARYTANFTPQRSQWQDQ